ncbi:hypothetical protein ACLB2K_022782 [Fragaria x ananassa]
MQSRGNKGFTSDFVVKLDKTVMDTATSKYAYAPGSSLPFPRSPEHWDNEQSLEESGDSEEILQPTSTLTKRKRSVVTKSGREEHAALLAEKIDRMCEVIESRCEAISVTKRSVESTSIKEVMKVVTSLPGAEQGTKLWFFATRLFLNQEKREMFCTIEDPNLKLEWLKFEMAEK